MQSCSLAAVMRALPQAPKPPPPRIKKVQAGWIGWPDAAPLGNKQAVIH